MTHRNDKIRQIRWEAGTVLPDIVQQETLSDQERVYFNSYSDLLSEYSQSLGIDLTSNLEPPKDLLIEIRVLQSCGEIMTESGPVELTKGTTNFLRRSEVEHLIREGLVEHVQNEDTC
jgi:GINS complex subunit 1